MPSKLEPPKLSRKEEKYANRVSKYIMMASGFAVQELQLQAKASLENAMYTQFKMRVQQFDPMKDENEELFGEKPRESVVALIKEKIIESAESGAKLWSAYKNLKSEFMNHWCPHYRMRSGENEDSAMENVRKHVWAFRKNRNVNKKNAKLAEEKKPLEKLFVPAEAPEATPDNWPLETAAFIAFHDHPFLAVTKRASSTAGAASTTSAGGSDNSTSQGEDDYNSNDDTRGKGGAKGDAKVAAGVASVLKSRKQQRTEALNEKKKRKIEATTLLNEKNKVAAESKAVQAKAAMIHAEALKEKIRVEEEKNKIEFLKLALQYNHADAQLLMKSFATKLFPTPAISKNDEDDAVHAEEAVPPPDTINILEDDDVDCDDNDDRDHDVENDNDPSDNDDDEGDENDD